MALLCDVKAVQTYAYNETRECKWNASTNFRHITEIEAIIPDMAGTARGKIIPRSKFESGESMRLPQAVMIQTITDDYPEDAMASPITT